MGIRSIPEFGQVVLRRIGIPPERIRVIQRGTRFESLIVPDRLWRISRSVNRRFDDILGRITAGHVRGRPDLRLYLSRSEIPRRSIGNERDIEDLFRRAGFEVLHPQNHGFPAQLELYGRAAVLAGLAGSALHNIIFCPKGAATISIGDSRAAVTRNQLVCGALAGGLTAAIPFAGDRQGFHIPTLAPELAAVLERLDDPRQSGHDVGPRRSRVAAMALPSAPASYAGRAPRAPEFAMTTETQKAVGDYWSARATPSGNWWTNRLVIRDINRRVIGTPYPEVSRGAVELGRRLVDGRRLRRGISLGSGQGGTPARDVLERMLSYGRRLLSGRRLRRGVSVGSGHGGKEIALVRDGFVEHMLCYDLAAARVAHARETAAGLGLAERIEFRQADAFALHSGPEFDFVYWNNSLHHMFDVPAALAWSRDVLRPGGLLLDRRVRRPEPDALRRRDARLRQRRPRAPARAAAGAPPAAWSSAGSTGTASRRASPAIRPRRRTPGGRWRPSPSSSTPRWCGRPGAWSISWR